ncbi:phosphatidylserine/phosphatidylglycerophosphate/cardiolipin synthase family protein [Uliginosibacterium paludis]|uniref:Phospholipase D-like domain-containing protein n=1 Tax=Uliginosibacterium paludis TaxID=1615952 RepID=A0ABV2CVH9_9RHOO
MAAVALMTGLPACAHQIVSPIASGPVPGTKQLARSVSITGPEGAPLAPQEKLATLRQVAAQGRPVLLQAQLAAMARFGDMDLYAGNRARLLLDGPATFAAMFEAIRGARRSILLESYIVEDARIARELAALLKARRAEGLDVVLLYDAVGSIGTDQAFFDGLRDAGVAVCKFNPVNPLERPGYWGISHRDHRKLLVVDDELAFTGGINISSVYSSGSMGTRRSSRAVGEAGKASGWRDTQIAIQGPAAGAMGTLFRSSWLRQGCEGEPGPVQPVSARRGGAQLVRIVAATPDDPESRIYRLLLGSIQAASHSIYMTMAYFAPGAEMLDALKAAARRGVDVKLVLPSLSDFTPVLEAGRASYADLLEAGVSIHELQSSVLHAKTAVIDGVVSTVGSSNMDWRSFEANDEVNAVVLGEDFAGEMMEAFRRDLAASVQISAAEWARRPLLQKLRQAFWQVFERFW